MVLALSTGPGIMAHSVNLVAQEQPPTPTYCLLSLLDIDDNYFKERKGFRNFELKNNRVPMVIA